MSFDREGNLYVVNFRDNKMLKVDPKGQVALDGSVKRILGNGERGIADGAGDKARLSFPNGIACDPFAQRLYINEYVNESESSLPRRGIVREIVLAASKTELRVTTLSSRSYGSSALGPYTCGTVEPIGRKYVVI